MIPRTVCVIGVVNGEKASYRTALYRDLGSMEFVREDTVRMYGYKGVDLGVKENFQTEVTVRNRNLDYYDKYDKRPSKKKSKAGR